MLTKVAVIVLFANAVMSYRLQSPAVEVCPHALRVSVADSSGIELFAFHGNINRPIGETEAGQMSQDVNHKTFGRWIFETESESFKLGDTINYWIFVQHRGLGYRSDVMSYTVNAFSKKCEAYQSSSSEEEDVHMDGKKFGRRRNKGEHSSHFQQYYHHHHHHHEEGGNRRSGYGNHGWNPRPPVVPPFPQPPTPLPFPTEPIGPVCFCDRELKKVTEKLAETQLQLLGVLNTTEKLQQDFLSLNEFLGTILEKSNFGRKLLLTGVFSANDNPYELIKTILEDKLDLSDLKLRVLNATTTVHGAILFEMTSSSDKLRILMRSKRLEKSKLRIIDYQDEDNELAEIFQISQSPSAPSSSTTFPITDGPDPDIDVRFGEN